MGPGGTDRPGHRAGAHLHLLRAINFCDAGRDATTAHAPLADLTAENATLNQRLENLEGPDAAERGARKIGMVNGEQGEAAYVVRGLNH